LRLAHQMAPRRLVEQGIVDGYLETLKLYAMDHPRAVTGVVIFLVVAVGISFFHFIHQFIKQRRLRQQAQERMGYPEEPGLILEMPKPGYRDQVLSRLEDTTGTQLRDSGPQQALAPPITGITVPAKASAPPPPPVAPTEPAADEEDDGDLDEVTRKIKEVQAEKRTGARAVLDDFESAGGEEGIRQAEEMLLREPENESVMDWLAFTYYTSDLVEKAIELYVKLLTKVQDKPEYFFYLANCYYKSGLFSDAIENWEHVLTMEQAPAKMKEKTRVSLQQVNELFNKWMNLGAKSAAQQSTPPTAAPPAAPPPASSLDQAKTDDLFARLSAAKAAAEDEDIFAPPPTPAPAPPPAVVQPPPPPPPMPDLPTPSPAFQTGERAGGGSIEEIQRKLAENPDDVELLDWLAYMHYSNDQLAECVEVYKRLIGIDPTKTSAYYYLGNAYFKLDDMKSAFRLWNHLIEHHPTDKFRKKAESRMEKVKALLVDFDEAAAAEPALEEPSVIEDDFAEEARRLAEEEERRRLEAEEQERLRLEAEEQERLRLEAEEQERLRREAEEQERLRREAEEEERLRREAEEEERLRREAEEQERQRREAEEQERQRREAEEQERLRREAAERAEKASRAASASAVAALEIAFQQEPDNLEFLALLADAYFDESVWDKACDAYEDLVAAGQASDMALYRLGEAHLSLGAPEKAMDVWDRLMREFPDSPFVDRAFEGLVRAKSAAAAGASVAAEPEGPSFDFGGLASFLPPGAAADAAPVSLADLVAGELEPAPPEPAPPELASLELAPLELAPLEPEPPARPADPPLDEKQLKRQELMLKDAFPEDRALWEDYLRELGGIGPTVTAKLEVYLESNLEQAPAWEFLAFCYQVQGHFQYAARVFEHLLKQHPVEARYHYYLGNVKWFLKQRDEALDHWADAVKHDPGGAVGTKATKKMAKTRGRV